MISGRAAAQCPVCGAQGNPLYSDLPDRMLDIPGTWRALNCPGCGLIWLDPRPLPESLPALYETYSTLAPPKQNTEGGGFVRKSWRSAKRGILAARFGYEELVKCSVSRTAWAFLSLLAPLREIIGGTVMFVDGSKKGKLLDVGCGNGGFLLNMKSLGWEVEGVEFDPEAARYAAEWSGAKVFAGLLEDANFPAASFDAITLHHVVEHLHDPARTLQECRRILKPGGKLHILTPNAQSLAHRIFRENWRGLEVPRHLQIYSVEAMRREMEKAGFGIQTLRTTARSAILLWNVSTILKRKARLPRPLVIGKWTKLEGLFFHVMEHFWCYFGDWGEEILAVGKN